MTKMHSQSFYVYSLQERLPCLSLFMKAGSSSKRRAGIKHQSHFSISTWYTSLFAFFMRLKAPQRQQAGLFPAAAAGTGTAGTGTPWKLSSTRAVSPDCQPRKLRQFSQRDFSPSPAHTAATPSPKSSLIPARTGWHLQKTPSSLAFRSCFAEVTGKSILSLV